MKLHQYPFVFALFLITACSSTDSGNVNSPGIYAGFSITNDGSQSNVTAQLKVGGPLSNTVLELSDGDSLVAYNGSQSHFMSKDSSLLGNVKYRASFPGDIGGTRYTITFNRPSTNESISSSATLPEDFRITSNHAITYTSADTLTISWDSSSVNTTDVSISRQSSMNSLCGPYSTSVKPGVSSVSIPLSTLSQFLTSPGNCTMTIRVSRSNSASVSASFGEGGSFSAKQSREENFSFTY